MIVIADAEHLSNVTPANLRLLYRIGLHSNTVTLLALFVQIELCFCNCIRRQTTFVTNTATAAQTMTRRF